MITIAVYDNAIDANIAKGLLESNDIHCQILHEMIAQTLPVGGVELQVDEEDQKRAQEILNKSDV